jgi:hypothetical protein
MADKSDPAIDSLLVFSINTSVLQGIIRLFK